MQGALFGVTRGAIRRRPKGFYQHVLRYFEGLGEVNPEEGHYMERFWYAILSDEAVDEVERERKEGHGSMVHEVQGRAAQSGQKGQQC